MNGSLTDALQAVASRTDAFLDRFLAYDPGCRAARLFEAIRYSSLDGGKRIRPFVAFAFADALGASLPDEFAAAVELIHCASLIHDDLPAMDNDDFRRGKPANHKKFDEATAILAGDAQTGVTVMRTDVGLDTGDMLLVREIPIAPDDTAATLSDKLSALGGECIVEALRKIEDGTAVFAPQPNEGVTLCKKIKKEECTVDFSKTSAEISNLIRAMNPAPLAFSYLRGAPVNLFFAQPAEAERVEGARAGEVVRADKTGIYVRAGEGIVRILELQAAGGKRMRAADFVNGRKVAVGDVFSKEPQ